MRNPIRFSVVAALIGFPLVLLGGAGCAGVGAAPTPAVGAVVDTSKVTVVSLERGVLTVKGAPGTVTGAKVTTVTLTVMREAGPPTAAYQLLHLGSGLPVGSSYAVVDAEGGFSAASVGSVDRPVASKDELNLIPQNGLLQAGFPAAIILP